jgi:hypothetical protein
MNDEQSVSMQHDRAKNTIAEILRRKTLTFKDRPPIKEKAVVDASAARKVTRINIARSISKL